MKIARTYRLLVLFLLLGSTVQASRIEKGYSALAKYDYFRAKKYFTLGLKYSPAPASQGLALIYLRKDNPFHNNDSALHYIQQSLILWDSVSVRKREKWLEFGFTKDSLIATRTMISTQAYGIARNQNTIESFDRFSKIHTWASEQPLAIYARDSIAFFDAVRSNTSEAYQSFLDRYPESAFSELARDNFYHTQFTEITGDGSEESYVYFIKNNPKSPLRDEAEWRLYELVTQPHTMEVYDYFIKTYPENRFNLTAWRAFFQCNLTTYSKKNIESFIASYPNAPILDEVYAEYEASELIYFPVTVNGKFGFMDQDGILKIDAHYDYVTPFKEGLSIYTSGNKQGVINKLNRTLLKAKYDGVSDFVNGFAVVELNEKLGMINRNGHEILPCIYEDIGMISEGLVYASLNEKYGYYSATGELMLNHYYDEANDFNGGIAKVRVEDKVAFVNKSGHYEIRPIYPSLRQFNDSVYVFEEDELLGLVNFNGNVITPAQFEEIGELSHGLAVAAKGNEIVYLDRNGKIVLAEGYEVYPNYLLKGEFYDSVAVVYKAGKYGRIDARHKVITKLKYQNIGRGKNYFPAQVEDSWGFYTNSGKTLISPKYQSLQLLSNDLLLAMHNDSLGILDRNGTILIPFSFNDIEVLDKDHFLVKRNSSHGVYSRSTLLIPVEYDQIGIFEGDFIYLNKGGILSFYDLKNKKRIELIRGNE